MYTWEQCVFYWFFFCKNSSFIQVSSRMIYSFFFFILLVLNEMFCICLLNSFVLKCGSVPTFFWFSMWMMYLLLLAGYWSPLLLLYYSLFLLWVLGCWEHIYLWLLYLLEVLTPLSLYKYIIIYIYFYLLLSFLDWSLSICHKYGYTHFFLVIICLEYHLVPLLLEPMCDFIAEMSVLKAAYCWVLFFNLSNHSVPFDWWVQFICI